MSIITDVTTERETTAIRERIRANPRPAAIWTAVALVLIALEAGGLFHFLLSITGDFIRAVPVSWSPRFITGLEQAVAKWPTLLSRETIPNQGPYTGRTQQILPGLRLPHYKGTFLGLPSMYAWLIRTALIYTYAFVWLGWVKVGYDWYREYYRAADWTPRDDVVNRFRGHYWGLFGVCVVYMFVVMAVFAPALGPTTVDKNLRNPYGHQVQYWDTESASIETVTVGLANRESGSTGGQENVGLMSYDDYGRFHPFGTLPNGKDLFTFLAAGSRVSLVIGVMSIALSGLIATVFALLSAYYKGTVDLGFVLLSDSIMALPQLLVLIMLTVILAGTWIGKIYSGAFVLGLIFAGTGWPYLWRSLRGPALQVSEQEWIDAAKSFGQRPTVIMRKHMLPYITGYLLIYGSMTLGGAIIAIAGLSFLGLGVDPPTPEWGRAVNMGQDYVATSSWHISLIPGILITLVVTGFNALGDGVRDAIDPQSDSAAGEAGGRGGGA